MGNVLTIIRIKSSKNGQHSFQTISNPSKNDLLIPDDFAFLPESIGTPSDLKSFPYGEITTEIMDLNNFEFGLGLEGKISVVTSWTPGVNPNDNQKPVVPLDKLLKAVSDRQEFLEDCIAEMAGQVYS